MPSLQTYGSGDERTAAREERRSVWLKGSLLLHLCGYWGWGGGKDILKLLATYMDRGSVKMDA
jgi:hypothetical protein